MADLFISHSNVDTEWTRELRRQLEAAGYTCWMAPDDVYGPVPWAEQILTAIQTCRVMIIVISRHSNTSSHVSKEVGVALEENRPLVPIRIEDIVLTGSLNYLLQLVQWIDAFPGALSDHLERIRRAVAYSIPADGGATSTSTSGTVSAAPPTSTRTLSAHERLGSSAPLPLPPSPLVDATSPLGAVPAMSPPPPLPPAPPGYPSPGYGPTGYAPPGYAPPGYAPPVAAAPAVSPPLPSIAPRPPAFTRRRTLDTPIVLAGAAAVTVAVVALVALSGALGGRSTPSGNPTAPIATTAFASPSASVALPSATSQATVAPTFSLAPTDTPPPSSTHAPIADLVALLPAEIDGLAMVSQSVSAEEVFGTDAASATMRGFVAGVGKQLSDLQLAESHDVSDSHDLFTYAFYLQGVDPLLLQQAIITGSAGAVPDTTTTDQTLGGRHVVRLSAPSQSSSVYVYAAHGAVFVVQSTDLQLAGRAIEATPVAT